MSLLPFKISQIIKDFPEVKNIHRIRSRGREDDMFLDLHVMVDENTTVKEAHLLVHKIERKIKEEQERLRIEQEKEEKKRQEEEKRQKEEGFYEKQ